MFITLRNRRQPLSSVTGTSSVNWWRVGRDTWSDLLRDTWPPDRRWKSSARTRLKWYRGCRSREAAVNRDRVGVRSYLPCCSCPMNNGGNKSRSKGFLTRLDSLGRESGNFIPILFFSLLSLPLSLPLSVSVSLFFFSTFPFEKSELANGSRSETRLRKLQSRCCALGGKLMEAKGDSWKWNY